MYTFGFFVVERPALEPHLEEKREALRRALRNEYFKRYYHPNAAVGAIGHIFDASMYRFNAMNCVKYFYQPRNLANFLKCSLPYPTLVVFCYGVSEYLFVSP